MLVRMRRAIIIVRPTVYMGLVVGWVTFSAGSKLTLNVVQQFSEFAIIETILISLVTKLNTVHVPPAHAPVCAPELHPQGPAYLLSPLLVC